MVEDDPNRIAAEYAEMSEAELIDVARRYDGLVEIAHSALRREFERRSLEPPLIDEPDAEALENSRGTLVTVARYRDLTEAMVARSALELEGISCFLLGENFVRLDWGYSNFIGGMRLQVAKQDEADALELLQQKPPEQIEVPGQAAFVQPICPRCGTDGIIAYDSGLKLAAASALTVGIPTRLTSRTSDKETWHCMNCGYNWADDSV